MKTINIPWEKLEENNYKSIALSLLRIFICFHLIKRLFFNWNNLDLLFGAESIVAHLKLHLPGMALDTMFLRENYKVFLMTYIVLIVLYLYGIGKHFVAFLLYILVLFFHRMNYLVLNGGDNLIEFLLLYLVFADSYQYFSITKVSFKSDLKRKCSNLLSNLACYSIVLHLSLIYMVSALHKINADVWFHGVAVYYTFSLERFTGTSLNGVAAKNQYFVTLSTYFTLFFELYFPLLVLFKKIKGYVILLGIMLHLGIYVFMMIYDFQMVFIFTYLAFFSDRELITFRKKYLDISLKRIYAFIDQYPKKKLILNNG